MRTPRAHRHPTPGPETWDLDLDPVHYLDCFAVEPPPGDRRTAEEWARAALEGIPASFIAMLLGVWSLAGLRLGPIGASPDRILGWKIERSTPKVLVLAAETPISQVRLVIDVAPRLVRLSTYVSFSSAHRGAILFRLIGPAHRRVVPYVLSHAAAQVAGVTLQPT